MKRFVDDGITTYDFLKYPILVECPFCQKHATVYQKVFKDEDCTKSLFSCQNCCKSFDQHEKQENNLGYFKGIYVNIDETCACKRGKYQFHQYYAQKSFVPQFFDLKCSFCPTPKRIYPNQFNLRKEFGYEFNSDPFFGYRLLLTTETRNGLIFVYNIEQLHCLKDYISANLRERTYHNTNKTYFNRLPAWIKSARNRKEILKALLRLEQMATTIQP